MREKKVLKSLFYYIPGKQADRTRYPITFQMITEFLLLD